MLSKPETRAEFCASNSLLHTEYHHTVPVPSYIVHQLCSGCLGKTTKFSGSDSCRTPPNSCIFSKTSQSGKQPFTAHLLITTSTTHCLMFDQWLVCVCVIFEFQRAEQSNKLFPRKIRLDSKTTMRPFHQNKN